MEIIRYFQWEPKESLIDEPEEWAAFTALKSIWNYRQFLTDNEQEIIQIVLSRKPVPVLYLAKLADVQFAMLKRITTTCTELERAEIREDKYRFIMITPTCNSRSYAEMLGYLRRTEAGLRDKWTVVNAFLHKVIQLAEI